MGCSQHGGVFDAKRCEKNPRGGGDSHTLKLLSPHFETPSPACNELKHPLFLGGSKIRINPPAETTGPGQNSEHSSKPRASLISGPLRAMIIINSAFGNCRRRVKTRPHFPSPAHPSTARLRQQEGKERRGGEGPLRFGEGALGRAPLPPSRTWHKAQGKVATAPERSRGFGAGCDAKSCCKGTVGPEEARGGAQRAGTDSIRAARGLHKKTQIQPCTQTPRGQR